MSLRLSSSGLISNPNSMSETILDVRNLKVEFDSANGVIKAVDGISFGVKRGRTLGIVGESGSGKSVTSLAVMGLVPNPPGRITQGEILFAEKPEASPVDLCTCTLDMWDGDIDVL